MTINLSPSSAADYDLFLKVKELPQYKFVGRTAIFPDEYAERLGLEQYQPASGEYLPIDGLFDYQRDITRLAVRKRKFAAFVAPGLGKTLMEVEFARHASERVNGRKSLIVAPLMVIEQTLGEVEKFYDGRLPIDWLRAKNLQDWLDNPGGSRIGITNYEALRDDTQQGRIGALILDESSSLKSAYSKWAQICIRLGRGLPWKFAGTGTPAPNDRIEYANHAVFLDHFLTTNSFLSRFFVNRGQTENRWELKPHALRPFYRALSHWCIFLNSPATYGWKDNADTIPPIRVQILDVPMTQEQRNLAAGKTGTLFGHAGGITTRGALSQIAKGHYQGQQIPTAKPNFIRDLIATWPNESTLVWCLYNAEQDHLERVMPDAASIRGETPYEKRSEIIADFKAGRVKTLISKPDVLGFGLNLQIATRMVFSGLEDSYEEFYQCVKRANRVGSTQPLNVYIPVTFIECPMIETVLAKAKRIESDTAEQEKMFRELVLNREFKC